MLYRILLVCTGHIWYWTRAMYVSNLVLNHVAPKAHELWPRPIFAATPSTTLLVLLLLQLPGMVVPR